MTGSSGLLRTSCFRREPLLEGFRKDFWEVLDTETGDLTVEGYAQDVEVNWPLSRGG